jgi:hypothetical protein
MQDLRRRRSLQLVLIAIGLVFAFGVLPLMWLWPAGWQWTPNQPEYEQMIVSVYAALGMFLLYAAQAPERHGSLILFAGVSSLAHGGIMLIQAVRDTSERGHLIGDVPALVLVGTALVLLAPRRVPTEATGDGGARLEQVS